MRRRPNTVLGLALRVAAIDPRARGGSALAIVIAVVLASFALSVRCAPARELRVVSFNIEDFPRDGRQVDGAFALLAELDAPIVAVQEITDPARFAHEAERRLGPDHRFVAAPAARGHQRVGLLFDRSRFRLAYARAHEETRVGGPGKPTLEVRLRGARRAIRIFVVHLKAGGDSEEVRRAQLRALAPIVRDAVEQFDDTVVLGDFNATGPADRESLAAFARATRLQWSSRELACTSYWNRRDGCLGSALDHVFTLRRAHTVARGPCETEGCARRDRCPAFHREVSDHCPVEAELR